MVQKLLLETHSDEKNDIFTQVVYDQIKNEKSFQAFIFSNTDENYLKKAKADIAKKDVSFKIDE